MLRPGALPVPPDGCLNNVLALDDTPLAWTRPHGQQVMWFGSRPEEVAPVGQGADPAPVSDRM